MSQPAALRRQPGMTQNQIQLGELIGLSPARNRLLVLTRWAFSFFTRGRGARLMTGTGRAVPAEPPSGRWAVRPPPLRP